MLNGHPEQRLPNTLNVSFIGLIGAELLAAVPEIAASTGSACHDGQVSISPVLAAMKVDPFVARGAVRLSVGRYTTEAEWIGQRCCWRATRRPGDVRQPTRRPGA